MTDIESATPPLETSLDSSSDDDWFHQSCMQQVWDVYKNIHGVTQDGHSGSLDLKGLTIFLQSRDFGNGSCGQGVVYDPSSEQGVYNVWSIVAMINFFHEMTTERFRASELIGITVVRMQRELEKSKDLEKCFFAGWCLALIMCRVRHCSKTDGTFSSRIDLDGNKAYSTLGHWWGVLDQVHQRRTPDRVDLKPVLTSSGHVLASNHAGGGRAPSNLFELLASEGSASELGDDDDDDDASHNEEDETIVSSANKLVRKLPHDAIFMWFCFEYQHHWKRILPVFIMQHLEEVLSTVNVLKPHPSECTTVTCLDVLCQASNFMFTKAGKTGWHNKVTRLDAWMSIASRFLGSSLPQVMIKGDADYASKAILASLRMMRSLLTVIHRVDRERVCFSSLGPLQNLIQQVVLSDQYPSDYLINIVEVALSCVSSIVKTRETRQLRLLVTVHLPTLATIFGHCLRISNSRGTQSLNYWTHIRQALLAILRPLQHEDLVLLLKSALSILDAQSIPVMCRTHAFVDHLTSPTTFFALPKDMNLLFSHENTGHVFQIQLDEIKSKLSNASVSPDDVWVPTGLEAAPCIEQMTKTVFHIPPSFDQMEKTLTAILNLEKPNFSIDAALCNIELRFDAAKPIPERVAWIAGLRCGLRPTTLANFIPISVHGDHVTQYDMGRLADVMVNAFLTPWRKRNGFISCSWLNRAVFANDERLVEHWLDSRNHFGLDVEMPMEDRMPMIGKLLKLWCGYVEQHAGVDLARYSEVLRQFWESDCGIVRAYYTPSAANSNTADATTDEP